MEGLVSSSGNFYYLFIVLFRYFNFNFYHYIYSNVSQNVIKKFFFKCDYLAKTGINNCSYIDINII